MRRRLAIIGAAPLPIAVVLIFVGAAMAQETAIQITVKGHSFQPSQLSGPANASIVLHVKNLDAAAMEFESVSLRVEKVIAANSEGVIRLRPLAAGRYEFFDDFHQQTRGALVVR
jgi:cupredoxin-like protein